MHRRSAGLEPPQGTARRVDRYWGGLTFELCTNATASIQNRRKDHRCRTDQAHSRQGSGGIVNLTKPRATSRERNPGAPGATTPAVAGLGAPYVLIALCSGGRSRGAESGLYAAVCCADRYSGWSAARRLGDALFLGASLLTPGFTVPMSRAKLDPLHAATLVSTGSLVLYGRSTWLFAVRASPGCRPPLGWRGVRRPGAGAVGAVRDPAARRVAEQRRLGRDCRHRHWRVPGHWRRGAAAKAVTTVRELQDFRIDVSNSGRMTFGARSVSHDDILLSLAIAC